SLPKAPKGGEGPHPDPVMKAKREGVWCLGVWSRYTVTRLQPAFYRVISTAEPLQSRYTGVTGRYKGISRKKAQKEQELFNRGRNSRIRGMGKAKGLRGQRA